MTRCGTYFAAEGSIVDQPFQPRAALRHDPLLHERGQGRWLRTPIGEGADSAAARGSRDSEAARPGPAHHAPSIGGAVFRLLDKDGSGMDASDDAVARHRHRVAADPLGRRFLYGPRTASAKTPTCFDEINVSSVFPFTEQAPPEIARRALDRLRGRRLSRSARTRSHVLRQGQKSERRAARHQGQRSELGEQGDRDGAAEQAQVKISGRRVAPSAPPNARAPITAGGHSAHERLEPHQVFHPAQQRQDREQPSRTTAGRSRRQRPPRREPRTACSR